MPTAPMPTYGGPQIQSQGIPNVKYSEDAPLEAFGGGASVSALNQATVGLGNTITKLGEDEKKKADDAVAIDAYAKTMSFKQNLLYDPTNGALNRRGKDALGVSDEYGQQFDKFTDDISKNMTPDQLEAYSKIKAQQREDLTGALEKHTFTEAQNYSDDVTKSGIAVNRDEAVLNYQDADKVKQAIEMQKILVLDNANKKGLPAELIHQQIEAVTSDTHQAVINRMLANQQDVAAKQYFDAHKDEISGADSTVLEKSLEEGNLRGQSQRFVDQMESDKLSPDQAMERIKTVQDPQLRDKINERYRNDQTEQKKLKEDQQVQLFQGAYNQMTQAKSLDAIPPNVMLSLTPAQQNEIKASYKNMMEGVPVKTDLPTYYTIEQMRNQDPQKFMQTDLTQYISKIGPEDLKGFMKQQQDAKNGKSLDGFESDKDAVDGVLKQAGIPVDPKNDNYVAARSAIDQAVIAQEKATGKKVNNDDLRSIAKQQTIQHITDKGLLWDTKKRTYQMTSADQDQGVVVPSSDSAAISKELQRRNIKPTPELISRYYLKGIQSGN